MKNLKHIKVKIMQQMFESIKQQYTTTSRIKNLILTWQANEINMFGFRTK